MIQTDGKQTIANPVDTISRSEKIGEIARQIARVRNHVNRARRALNGESRIDIGITLEDALSLIDYEVAKALDDARQ